LAEGARSGRIMLHQSLRSSKDYVALPDVVAALQAIAEHGGARLYNVASGSNTTHDAIAAKLSECCGWRFDVRAESSAWRFPRIDITRLSTEFAAPRRSLLEDLPWLAAAASSGIVSRC
jgi:nucleoside-diphosphate-sugar epimerase